MSFGQDACIACDEKHPGALRHGFGVRMEREMGSWSAPRRFQVAHHGDSNGLSRIAD
jgi:hypothetical protein